MSNILLITSSARADSYSTRVARALAEKLSGQDAAHPLTVRDLARQPLPHVDDTFATSRNLPADKRTPAQVAVLKLSDALIQELFAADIIIIAAAMYNFGIPSSLKAYIDHIVRPGVTFRYGEKGPEGLLKNKKVYLVLARGGIYTQGPMQALNFQDPYLRAVLGFIGVTDVQVIPVEGLAFGPEATEKSLAAAMQRVNEITV